MSCSRGASSVLLHMVVVVQVSLLLFCKQNKERLRAEARSWRDRTCNLVMVLHIRGYVHCILREGGAKFASTSRKLHHLSLYALTVSH